MLAVVQVKWHQYIVQEGTKLVVDYIDTDEAVFSDFSVIALFDAKGEQVQVGTPTLSNVTVTADVVGSGKGEKINVLKFHRKNRYERNKGFRPLQTTLLIKNVALNG